MAKDDTGGGRALATDNIADDIAKEAVAKALREAALREAVIAKARESYRQWSEQLAVTEFRESYELEDGSTVTVEYDSEGRRAVTVRHAEERLALSNPVIEQLKTATIPKRAPVTVVNGKTMLDKPMKRKGTKRGKLSVAFLGNDVNGLSFTPTADKVLYCLTCEIARSGYRYGDRRIALEVTLDMAEMARDWGWRGTLKEFTRKRRNDLRAILALLVSWEGGGSFRDMNLLAEIDGGDEDGEAGVISVAITGGAMHDIFRQRSARIPMYRELLAVDTRAHPLAFDVGCKLVEHRWENPAREGGFLSVRALVQACAFPSEAELKTKRQSTRRYLLEPLMKSLRHLEEIGLLEGFEFTHAKGEPLTAAEYDAMLAYDGENLNPPDWDTVKGLFLDYRLSHEEEHAEFRQRKLEGRAKGREAKEAAKERKAERKKADAKAQARAYNKEIGTLRAREDHKRELEARKAGREESKHE